MKIHLSGIRLNTTSWILTVTSSVAATSYRHRTIKIGINSEMARKEAVNFAIKLIVTFKLSTRKAGFNSIT